MAYRSNLPSGEVPVVHDSGWYDSHVIVVAVRAVVQPIIVTQSHFYRQCLVEGSIALDAAELLSC